MADVLRTPDDRFDGLVDYPWEPRYFSVRAHGTGLLRMHYVEDGPPDGPLVLLLHGEPSWSYLYRKMIPLFAAEGFRVIAPDLIGFGKSDKLGAVQDYSYVNHVSWLEQFVLGLRLRKIHLVCQDWGGLLGLRVLARNPDRFSAVVTANTGLPDGTRPLPEAFQRWLEHSQSAPELQVGEVLKRGTTSHLPDAVVAAYDAPFPDARFKAGSRAFPTLVPRSAEDPEAIANQKAWKILEAFHGPWLTAFSDRDPITAGGEKAFQLRVPGTRGLDHPTLRGAGHFLQEDAGPELAALAIAHFKASVRALSPA